MPGAEEEQGWLTEVLKCAACEPVCNPRPVEAQVLGERPSSDGGSFRRGFNVNRAKSGEDDGRLSRTRSSWERYKNLDPDEKKSPRGRTSSSAGPSSGGSKGKGPVHTKAQKRINELKYEAARKDKEQQLLSAALGGGEHPEQINHIKNDDEYEEVYLIHDFFGDPNPRVGSIYAELSCHKGEHAFIIDDEYASKFWWLCKTPGKKNYRIGFLPFNHLKKVYG